MTEQLYELTTEGHDMVKTHLEADGRIEDLNPAELAGQTVEIPGLYADLETLHERLTTICDEEAENALEIEARAAPYVHQCLNITRREAAIEGLWHWLTVVEFPYFVYRRWDGYSDIVGKFLEGRTNIYSNAIHRLWWIAELTYEPDEADPYGRTQRVFRQGTLANKVFDRWFARYDRAAKCVVDELDGESASNVIDPTTKNIKNELSNYQLELMDEDDIRSVVQRVWEDKSA